VLDKSAFVRALRAMIQPQKGEFAIIVFWGICCSNCKLMFGVVL